MAHMSISTAMLSSLPRRALFAIAAVAVLALPQAALAAKPSVHLRVVDAAGATLSQKNVSTRERSRSRPILRRPALDPAPAAAARRSPFRVRPRSAQSRARLSRTPR